jgi:hypothetical protein
MKNVLTYIGVSAAALIMFGSQPVQAQDAAKANIPFSFHTKIASYEGGTYTVTAQESNNSLLVLMNDDTRKATFVSSITQLDPTAKTDARGPVMVFKCGQGSCSLAEVWTASRGYLISQSPALDEEATTTRIVALVRAAR